MKATPGRKAASLALAGLLAMAASAPTPAHHSQVLFDMTKCLALTGTVRDWQFQSPHSWLWIVATNSKGTTDVWGFEASSPPQMVEAEHRWNRDVVKKGDKVTVKYSPLKDGRTGGALNILTLPDGTSLRAATPACQPAQPAGAPAK